MKTEGSLGSMVSKLTWSLVPEGPWTCRCGKILEKRGRGSDDALIHHVDEDRSNNDINNLEIMCGACHRKHHRAGKPGNNLGKKYSDKARENMSAAHRGKKAAHGYTEEVIRKMRDSKKGKPHVEPKLKCECGKITHAGPMSRHVKASGHEVTK